jgi:hypothetical protein
MPLPGENRMPFDVGSGNFGTPCARMQWASLTSCASIRAFWAGLGTERPPSGPAFDRPPAPPQAERSSPATRRRRSHPRAGLSPPHRERRRRRQTCPPARSASAATSARSPMISSSTGPLGSQPPAMSTRRTRRAERDSQAPPRAQHPGGQRVGVSLHEGKQSRLKPLLNSAPAVVAQTTCQLRERA